MATLGTAANEKPKRQQRAPGVKPENPRTRRELVESAVRSLTKDGAAFTVADIAERTGISRATIYRHDELRGIIGAKGDGVRSVDIKAYQRLEARCQALKAKARDFKRDAIETERARERMQERAAAAEHRIGILERRIIDLEQRRIVADSNTALHSLAEELGKDSVKRARRQLARALHPDLFAQEPAAVALATELLKTLNILAS